MTDPTPQAAPEFGGKCAFGVALGGLSKAPVGKPEHSVVVDGKTYYFSGALPKQLFKLLGLAKRADARGARGA